MTVPPLGGRQDRAALAAGHVDADDRDVGGAARARSTAVGQRDRVAGVGDRDHVGEPGRARAGRPRAWCGTTPMVRARAGAPGGGQGQRAGLARAADRPRRRAAPVDVLAHHPGGQRRARRRRPSPPAPARPAGRRGAWRRWSGRRGSRTRRPGTCSERPSQRGQPVLDHQRGQGQRDQGGDPVADRAGRAATPGRPPRRCRPACRRSRSRGSASCRGRRRCRAPPRGPRSPSPPCGALELAERRRVEVEPLDPDPDLVGPELAAGVEPLRRLGQHAGRREHPVQPDRAGRFGHAGLPGVDRWPEIVRRFVRHTGDSLRIVARAGTRRTNLTRPRRSARPGGSP